MLPISAARLSPTRGCWPPARATAGDISHTWPLAARGRLAVRSSHAWPPRLAHAWPPRLSPTRGHTSQILLAGSCGEQRCVAAPLGPSGVPVHLQSWPGWHGDKRALWAALPLPGHPRPEVTQGHRARGLRDSRQAVQAQEVALVRPLRVRARVRAWGVCTWLTDPRPRMVHTLAWAHAWPYTQDWCHGHHPHGWQQEQTLTRTRTRTQTRTR